jgi:dsRNA-specific ribonuclease
MSNQRLEFLGDAVLDFAVLSLIFNRQPWARQGDLSKQRTESTNNIILGRFGFKIGLHHHLQVATLSLVDYFNKLKMQSQYPSSGEFTRISKVLADAFEAIIGAVYIDSGGSMDEIYKIIHTIDLLPQLMS